jgi:hypothetical protein
MSKLWICRIAVWLWCMALGMVAAGAHDLPLDRTMNGFVKIGQHQADFIVRVPLDLLVGVPFPVAGDHYDIGTAEPAVQGALAVLASNLVLWEGSVRLVPSSARGARRAVDHQRPAGLAERHEADRQPRIVAEVGGKCALDREHRVGRSDRVHEMGIEIAHLVADDRIWGRRPLGLRERIIVAPEREVGERRQLAIENVVDAGLRRRWIIAGLFGLVHGFGFADIVAERLQFAGSNLLAALLAFNIGIEIGQLAVLCVFVPALALLLRGPMSGRMGIIVVSVIVAHTAWHWMIDRAQVLWITPWPLPTPEGLALLARWIIALVLAVIVASLLTRRTDRQKPGRAESGHPSVADSAAVRVAGQGG